MNEYDSYIHDEHGPPRRWVSPLAWSALGLLAFLIYEVTMQPALASVTLCVRFGWEDFRTGLWLNRADPYRPRGRACRALYFSYGLAKVAVAAFVLFFVFAIVEGGQQPQAPAGPQNPAAPAFAVPFVTAFLGCSFLTVTASWAFWLAYFYDMKLWLHPAVHRDRRRQLWPPGMSAGGRNRVSLLLFFSLGILFLTAGVILFVVIAVTVGNAQQQGGPAGVFALASFLLILFGFPVAMLALNSYLLRRLAARSPAECWVPVPVGEPVPVEELDLWAEEAE